MKKEWFFFPVGIFMRAIGGIPVDRDKSTSLTDRLGWLFSEHKQCNLAITPEGTRAHNDKWHTGFLRIAHTAQVPIQCGVIDYSRKCVFIEREFYTTGDFDRDMDAIRTYFAQYTNAARYPEKFASKQLT